MHDKTYLDGVLESSKSNMRDDGSSEEVDHQTFDSDHFRIVLENGTREEKARFCSGRNFIVWKLVQGHELENAELNHVKDVAIVCATDDLK